MRDLNNDVTYTLDGPTLERHLQRGRTLRAVAMRDFAGAIANAVSGVWARSSRRADDAPRGVHARA